MGLRNALPNKANLQVGPRQDGPADTVGAAGGSAELETEGAAHGGPLAHGSVAIPPGITAIPTPKLASNVMATFGTGQLFTTKPYVAGANYISKMSDYCESCQFKPGKDCPVTRLYWSFLERNTETLENNPRLRPIMMGLRKRAAEEKLQDQRVFDWVTSTLDVGDRLEFGDYPTGT